MSERIRAADDIEAINKRIEELRKEREAALNKPADDAPVPAVQTSLEWGMYLTSIFSARKLLRCDSKWEGWEWRQIDDQTVALVRCGTIT